MIIVFDSGIGGFSILREMLNEKLTGSILYLCDQINFPYGDKSSTWLAHRLSQIALWARELQPEAFVIACNTGTVSGITEMRKILSCPVVGVEPVIKPLSQYENTLVLATQATTQSLRTKELLKQYGSHIHVYAPHGLAVAIENNNNEQVKNILDEISEIIHREKIEAIGLSCTHYPLIKDQMSKSFPKVNIYDPSHAVVSQLKKVIEIKSGEALAITFQTTGAVVRFNQQIESYFGKGHKAEHVKI